MQTKIIIAAHTVATISLLDIPANYSPQISSMTTSGLSPLSQVRHCKLLAMMKGFMATLNGLQMNNPFSAKIFGFALLICTFL